MKITRFCVQKLDIDPHFTSKERESIYLLLKQNKKISEIAIELGGVKIDFGHESVEML